MIHIRMNKRPRKGEIMVLSGIEYAVLAIQRHKNAYKVTLVPTQKG